MMIMYDVEKSGIIIYGEILFKGSLICYLGGTFGRLLSIINTKNWLKVSLGHGRPSRTLHDSV